MQGKAQGIQGIYQLTSSGKMTYVLLCAIRQGPSRETAGNNGLDCGVRLFRDVPRYPQIATRKPKLL
jgi:hypothetical protein